ncbi:MAG: hypothetical protein SVK08_07425 [Halobacteriota archaeon]|nr:hypothetical protein [Halobacteriota archaeon]
MRLKARILLSLLKHNNLTTSQVADLCGYKDKANKYGIVDGSLKELKRDGYIISPGKMKQSTGRPPTCYSVKEDLEVVKRIYKNFPELQEELRQKEWVLDLVLGKISIIEEEDVDKIRMMLYHSPNLFKLCLENYTTIDKTADLLRMYIKTPIMVDIDENTMVKNFEDDEMHMYRSFHELFTFSVFLDYLEGKATNESMIFMRQIREELLEEDRKIQNFIISVEVMKTLKVISKLVRSDDWASMESRLVLIVMYNKKRDIFR